MRPCLPEDVAWSKAKLGGTTNRVTARSMDEDVAVEEESKATGAASAMSINLADFMKS